MQPTAYFSTKMLYIVAQIVVLYLCWYVWTFKLTLPWRPKEPRSLPYLIPFVGHARWFFKDRDALFAYGKKYFNDDPCTLTIAGNKLYMVTMPQQFSEVYKSTTALSFDLFVRELHQGFSMSPKGVEKMWEVPMAHEKHRTPPGRKHLVDRSSDFHRLQLLPGPQLEELNDRFLSRIEHGTSWNNVPKSCIVSSTSEEMTVSLYRWCGEVLVDAATRAFYGDALVDTEPRLIHDFLEFDEHSWMLLYQYPSIFAKVMTAPRDRVMRSFDRYVSLPSERRQDAASYTKSLEAEQVKAGVAPRDIAIGFQIFHFAMNANAYKMCFWLLAHTIFDRSLLASIRMEIAPAVKGGKIDINYLVDEARCPILNAAFNEALRYTSAATSGRVVISPTSVGGKMLYPGARVLMPYRLGHFDEHQFGPNANDFDPQRFLKKKGLANNPAYRPFGGGSQYCSGRFLARREVVGFLAFALDRFEMDLNSTGAGSAAEPVPQRFPRQDVNKPNLGIISPMPGDDIRVSIRHRKNAS
ncbi:MAG: hypothetical protein Q9216_005555 [Gyalolechia sp. 2 TL-2023]